MDQPFQSYARKDAAQGLVDEMEDPRGEGEAPEVMLPSALFPKGCKEGAAVTVKGIVGKMGNKVGFTPTEVVKEGGDKIGAMENGDAAENEGKY
jgi:hypothetical protein